MHGNGNDRDREFAGYLMFIFEPLSETILRISCPAVTCKRKNEWFVDVCLFLRDLFRFHLGFLVRIYIYIHEILLYILIFKVVFKPDVGMFTYERFDISYP